MIRYTDNGAAFVHSVKELKGAAPFDCRLISLCRTFPPGLPFVDYWLILDKNDACTGAIARNGTAFILCLTAESALPEVNAFLLMAGAKEVLCGDFPLSGFQTERAGVILQAAKAVAYPQKPITEPSIRDAYAVLTACAGPHFVPPAWEDFFVDVNHKLRHGAMRLVGTEQEGALAAVAMTVAEDEFAAVIGAVACHPNFRRTGCGSAVTAHLVHALSAEGKQVFVHRAAHENAAFYAALGFEPVGRWREYAN